MAVVWRLVRPDFADRLDGRGNIRRGARWNSPGRGVVYASFNLSLCVLEAFIQLPVALRVSLPEMAAVKVEIPESARYRNIERTELPSDLSNEPAVWRRCRELGDTWLATADQLVPTAPSFVVPQERNIMLNPTHPLTRAVKIASIEPFRFDPRLAPSA